MSAPTRPRPRASGGRTTRGPLPPGIYWRRRVFVLGTAVALVFLIAQVLTAGSDGSDGSGTAVDPVAEQAGAAVSSKSPSATSTPSGATDPTATGPAAGAPTTPTVAPVDPATIAPTGECDPEDVVVTPSVTPPAVAGQDVALTLTLTTIKAQACTFQVGPDSVVVKIVRGVKDIWTTQRCPDAVPTASVVVRQALPTAVGMTWSGLESGTDRCAGRGGWVLPNDFTIVAATLGGEPVEAPFSLVLPTPETVVVTEKPKKKSKG